MPDPRLVAAEAEQQAAHRRLGETLGLLKARLAPRALAGQAITAVKDGVQSGAEGAARFVADNPGKTAGVGLALAGGLFALLRRGSADGKRSDDAAKATASGTRRRGGGATRNQGA